MTDTPRRRGINYDALYEPPDGWEPVKITEPRPAPLSFDAFFAAPPEKKPAD
ncbi:hypothetical protein [Pseudoroseicyclus sp. CXY001]|uniref:hypothetical protein n=1 Tax=Pseudoroseicyclus sp. CXY001 TaxID=3242492 RepID=UPI003570C0AB